jgi:hypothetical protein
MYTITEIRLPAQSRRIVWRGEDLGQAVMALEAIAAEAIDDAQYWPESAEVVTYWPSGNRRDRYVLRDEDGLVPYEIDPWRGCTARREVAHIALAGIAVRDQRVGPA